MQSLNQLFNQSVRELWHVNHHAAREAGNRPLKEHFDRTKIQCGIADPDALFDALCDWVPDALCEDD
ncbi:MAG: hypothetical protein KJP03_07430 [Gammaproteobacteria bacterium]|nr:hypothetical protein [Gammaproteobacteria bacterium]